MLDALNQHLRLACRGLWRAKTFTGTAVLTLAFGIAGATVMFALIQGVLLRPLPVRDQDQTGRCVEGTAHVGLRAIPVRRHRD